MKLKEKTQLASLEAAEAIKLLADTQKKLASHKLKRYSRQSVNVRESKALRLKIALIKTFLKQKELNNG